jgi:hypothetical protein
MTRVSKPNHGRFVAGTDLIYIIRSHLEFQQHGGA